MHLGACFCLFYPDLTRLAATSKAQISCVPITNKQAAK